MLDLAIGIRSGLRSILEVMECCPDVYENEHIIWALPSPSQTYYEIIHSFTPHTSRVDGATAKRVEVLVHEVRVPWLHTAPPLRTLAPLAYRTARLFPLCVALMHNMHHAPDEGCRKEGKRFSQFELITASRGVTLSRLGLALPAVTYSNTATQVVDRPSPTWPSSTPPKSLPLCSKKYATLPRVVRPIPLAPAFR